MPDSSPEDDCEWLLLLRRVDVKGRASDGSWAPLSLLTSMPRKAVGAHMAMAHGLKSLAKFRGIHVYV